MISGHTAAGGRAHNRRSVGTFKIRLNRFVVATIT